MHLEHDVVCPTVIGRESATHRSMRGCSRVPGRERARRPDRRRSGRRQVAAPPRDDRRSPRRRASSSCSGACFEAERSIPYAPLLDLVRLFAGCGIARRSSRTCWRRRRPSSSTIFPELRPLLPDAIPNPTIDPESDRATAVSRARAGRHAPRSHAAGVPRVRGRALERRRHPRAGVPSRAEPQRTAASSSRSRIAARKRGRGSRVSWPTSSGRASSTSCPSSDLVASDVGAMLQAIFGPRENLGDRSSCICCTGSRRATRSSSRRRSRP